MSGARPGVSGFGAGRGADTTDPGADLLVPVREQLRRVRVQEEVAQRVAALGRPVLRPREQADRAGVAGEDVHRAADHVRRVGAQALQHQLDVGPHGPFGYGRRLRRGPPVDTLGEIAQMRVLVRVQPEGTSKGIYYSLAVYPARSDWCSPSTDTSRTCRVAAGWWEAANAAGWAAVTPARTRGRRGGLRA